MNRTRNTSLYLSQRHAQSIIDAAAFAYLIGFPLNKKITIRWKDVCAVNEINERSRLFLKRMYDWLEGRNVPTAYAYVFEDGRSVRKHQHINLHVPRTLMREFNRYVRDWLGNGTKSLPRTALVTKAYENFAACENEKGASNSMEYIAELRKSVAYLLKQAQPDICEALNIGHEPPFRPLPGQRAGTSRLLGPQNRKTMPDYAKVPCDNKCRMIQWPPLFREAAFRLRFSDPIAAKSLYRPSATEDIALPKRYEIRDRWKDLMKS